MMQAQAFQGVRPSARPAAFRPAAVSRRPVVVTAATAVAPPATLPYKGVDGSDKGTQQLSLKVAEDTAKGLVHRYMVLVQQNARQGTASTLTRSEVRGGGKKPYAQKGTGNARRGSNVSPLFPGGGVSFGPKPKDWTIKMNKQERRLALATALQSAAKDIIVVESLAGKIADRKTKSLVSVLTQLGANPTKIKVLVITKEAHEDVTLAGRNIEKLTLNVGTAIGILDVLHADKIIIEDGALAHVQAFYGEAAETA